MKGGKPMAAQITTKNLTVLSELMTIEELNYKKSLSYASQTDDPALKTKFNSIASNHKKRFDALLSYLNSHE